MVTPDPRRGDEPGDPHITPGSPDPDEHGAGQSPDDERDAGREPSTG